MRSVVITGTDTNVGKTFISALLMAGLEKYRYWKPIQSGLDGTTDSSEVQRLAECEQTRILPERYRFQAPLSPHAASKLEGRRVDKNNLLALPPGPVIVEGAGGVLVPLNERTLYIDIFCEWKLPLIVVARSTLGTISHTLLTLESLRSREIEILGCILNGPANSSNRSAIEHYGNVEVLGAIEPIATPDADTLKRIFNTQLSRLREVLV